MKRRKPKWRRKGETLEMFQRRQMAYTDRVIWDMVKPRVRISGIIPTQRSLYGAGSVK